MELIPGSVMLAPTVHGDEPVCSERAAQPAGIADGLPF
jgi:hypothetical protein